MKDSNPVSSTTHLEAIKKSFDIQVEAEKAATGEVSLRTALAWWDVATAIRDLKERQ